MNLADLVAPEHLDHARLMVVHKIRQGAGAITYEMEFIARDGRRVPVEVSTRLLFEDDDPVGVQGIARDISERKRAEEVLRNMSLIDPLTGLYNRRGAVTLADQQLKVAQRLGRSMLIVYADLNQLKRINDTFGHTAGNAALVEAAEVLKETSAIPTSLPASAATSLWSWPWNRAEPKKARSAAACWTAWAHVT